MPYHGPTNSVRRLPRILCAGVKLGVGGLLLAASVAQAAWTDIKEGLGQKDAFQQVGAPLIQNKARKGALETWTYDDGAYIFFENGRVRYWQAPRAKKP
jgi:hypothetical protein